jgi:metal-responsive CopG/Arc/MetJ family transcriptional regulator
MPSVIKIPQELARELDRLAEAEHKPRAAFVVELLRHDVLRAKQREALRLSAGAWNPAKHPELAKGGAARVEKIRSEPYRRFEGAIRRQKG